jgi:hypothetical protein
MKKKYFVIENDKGEHFAVLHLKDNESEERFIERIMKVLHQYAEDVLELGLRVKQDTVVLTTQPTGDIRVEFRWQNSIEREVFYLVETTLF